jgi:hypothetical protein
MLCVVEVLVVVHANLSVNQGYSDQIESFAAV